MTNPVAHTPGPWKVIASPHGRKYKCVQIGVDEGYTTLELEPADARLIAAAPRLLAALGRLADDECLDDDDPALIDSRVEARAAIAEATGAA